MEHVGPRNEAAVNLTSGFVMSVYFLKLALAIVALDIAVANGCVRRDCGRIGHLLLAVANSTTEARFGGSSEDIDGFDRAQ